MLKLKLILILIFIYTNIIPAGVGHTQEFEELSREEIKFKLLKIKIQPGDTLHKFAERYLDDPSRWPELLEYNKIPSGNPDLIIPGDILKVPAEMVKDEIADIFFMKNNVRTRRKGVNVWKAAKLYQRLYPEDGIRTARNSFSKIKYLKGGRASIGENSLVFLRPGKKRDDVIRLEIGELTARDVKVLTASASIDPEKGSEYTATVDKMRTTRLSVLKGKVNFISSGETVTVNEGFMSIAELDKPPLKPIKLPEPPKFKKMGKMEEMEGMEEKITRDENITTGMLNSEYLMEQIDLEPIEKETDSGPDKAKEYYIKEIHIQVAQDKEFSRIIVDRVVKKASKESWKESLKDGLYWWRAAFINQHGVRGRYSDSVELNVNRQLQKLEIYSPKDGEKIEKKIVTIKGMTGRDVTITVNNNDAIVYDDGSFIAAAYLQPGPNKITIKAIDSNRRITIKSITLFGMTEKGEPGKTKVDAKQFDIKINSPRDGEKINKRIVVIRGKTKRGVSVTANDNRAVVEKDGSFVAAIRLKSGPNKILIKAIDSRNRVASEEITVFGMIEGESVETVEYGELPVIEINSPRDGEKIKRRIVVIRGRTIRGVAITVNDERAVVEEDYSFITGISLKPGPNKIVVKATDSRNRVTTEEITIFGMFKGGAAKIVEYTEAPLIEISSPRDGEKIKKRIVIIRGKTRTGVSLTVNDERAVVEEDGSFVAAVYLKPGANKIIVKATDAHNRVTIKDITVQGIYK